MIGEHQAAILLALAESEANATPAPTIDELVEIASTATGRRPSLTRESVEGLRHNASIERVPEDRRMDWNEARVRMSDLGRGDLAKWQSRSS